MNIEPRPLLTGEDADRLQARIARLRDIAHARQPFEPTFRCVCRETGWQLVDEDGRATYRRCSKCDGPARSTDTTRRTTRRATFGDDL